MHESLVTSLLLAALDLDLLWVVGELNHVGCLASYVLGLLLERGFWRTSLNQKAGARIDVDVLLVRESVFIDVEKCNLIGLARTSNLLLAFEEVEDLLVGD